MDTPSLKTTFTRLALEETSRAQIEIQLLEHLQQEYLRALPQVVEFMKAKDVYSQAAQKYLGVLYDKCFLGIGSRALLSKYSVTGQNIDNIQHWKKSGLDLFLQYANEASIILSPDLRRFLMNSDKAIDYVDKKRRLAKLTQGDPIERKTEEVRVLLRSVLEEAPQEASPTLHDIEALTQKIMAAEVDGNSWQSYVYRAARNWIADRIRKLEARPRIEARQREKMSRHEAQRQKFESAKDEFRQLMFRLANDASLRPIQLKHLEILFATIFEDLSDAELARRFPGTPEARYQWRRRGRVLVWPMISENLRDFLKKKMK